MFFLTNCISTHFTISTLCSDYSVLWKFIFRLDGKFAADVSKHPVVMRATKVVQQLSKSIEDSTVTLTTLSELKSLKREALEGLLSTSNNYNPNTLVYLL